MTKEQAAYEFARLFLPFDQVDFASDREAIEAARHARDNDEIAFNEDWNNFTDMLYKDGRIETWQYNGWTGPDFYI